MTRSKSKIIAWGLPKEGMRAILERMDELREMHRVEICFVSNRRSHILQTDIVYRDPGPPSRDCLIALVGTIRNRRRIADTSSIATGLFDDEADLRSDHVPAAEDLKTRAMTELNLPKQYDPQDAQDRFYEFWVERGYFHADPASSPAGLLHRDPAAQRHRRAPPGPRAQ